MKVEIRWNRMKQLSDHGRIISLLSFSKGLPRAQTAWFTLLQEVQTVLTLHLQSFLVTSILLTKALFTLTGLIRECKHLKSAIPLAQLASGCWISALGTALPANHPSCCSACTYLCCHHTIPLLQGSTWASESPAKPFASQHIMVVPLFESKYFINWQIRRVVGCDNWWESLPYTYFLSG